MSDTKKKSKPNKTLPELVEEAKDMRIDLSPTGLGAWSMSKLKTLQKCPLKFYMSYVLKYKPESPPISDAVETGKAAHRILEFITNGKTMSQAYSLTRKEFPQITDSVWAEEVESLEFSIQKFQDRLENFKQNWGIKRIFQEVRLGCTKDWEPTGFFADDVYFRGVIDLALQLDNNDLIILDHKKGLPAITGIRNQKDQLDSYKVLFHHGLEKVHGSQAGIHFIKDAEIKLDDYAPAAEIEGRLRGILEFSIQGAIDGLCEIGFFKHKACSICKYCEYEPICKSGQLKAVEKETSRFF